MQIGCLFTHANDFGVKIRSQKLIILLINMYGNYSNEKIHVVCYHDTKYLE